MKSHNNQLLSLPSYKKMYFEVDFSTTSKKPLEQSLRSIVCSRYRIVEMSKADNPVGDNQDDWHRYVLERGKSRITGYHRGTNSEVTKYVNEFIEQINERNSYNKSKCSVKKSRT